MKKKKKKKKTQKKKKKKKNTHKHKHKKLTFEVIPTSNKQPKQTNIGDKPQEFQMKISTAVSRLLKSNVKEPTSKQTFPPPPEPVQFGVVTLVRAEEMENLRQFVGSLQRHCNTCVVNIFSFNLVEHDKLEILSW